VTDSGASSMNRRTDVLVSCGVAAAVAGMSLVLGQIEAAVPQAAITKVQAAPEKVAGAKAKAPAKVAGKAEVVEKKAAPKAARKAVMAKRVVAVQLGAVPDDQVQQYVQQFRPMVRTEYYFIRNVCDLTKEQRKQVAREGERAVLAAARRFAEEQQKMMRGGWRPGSEQPDPHRLLVEVLAKSVPPMLTPAQAARYREELEKRAASRKQVALDNLVAKLDQDLVLDSDQREKISSSLSSHWNDAWCQSLQMLMNIENFFPNVPDNLVVPFLTEHQRSSWQRIPKNQNVFFGFAFNGMAENDPLDDPELAEARREAEAEAAKAKAAGNEPKKP
jgi:hypothetical protein